MHPHPLKSVHHGNMTPALKAEQVEGPMSATETGSLVNFVEYKECNLRFRGGAWYWDEFNWRCQDGESVYSSRACQLRDVRHALDNKRLGFHTVMQLPNQFCFCLHPPKDCHHHSNREDLRRRTENWLTPFVGTHAHTATWSSPLPFFLPQCNSFVQTCFSGREISHSFGCNHLDVQTSTRTRTAASQLTSVGAKKGCLQRWSRSISHPAQRSKHDTGRLLYWGSGKSSWGIFSRILHRSLKCDSFRFLGVMWALLK